MAGPNLAEPARLKGYLRMVQVDEPLPHHPFDGERLRATQTRLERRKKSPIAGGGIRDAADRSPSEVAVVPFVDLVSRNRFVCFFIVQGSKKNFHSRHTLTLRQRLALKFNKTRIATLVVFAGEPCPVFCQGTGFATFPPSPTLLTILNITQVPSLVIVDTKTGRPIHADAALALQWNDPETVLDAWEKQQSGLSWTQKVISVLTFQSNCAIS